MRTYDTYKDSGISWLGQIPSHWDVIPIRHILQLKKRIVGDKVNLYTLLSLTLQGIIKRDLDNPKGKFPSSFDAYQVVEKNDFVFCNFDNEETPRAVGLSAFDGMITGAYDVFSCKNDNANIRFLNYYFLNIDEFKRFKPLYKGLRKSIPIDALLAYKVAVPPLAEQEAIVAYLDRATAEIDKAIASQQRMVELLQERKQIIINQAVTQGLNPDAPMKPTNIDWLPQIPAHWDVKMFKHLYRTRTGITFTKAQLEDKGERVISYGQIHSKLNWYSSVNPELIRYIPESLTNGCDGALAYKGDFLFADTSEDFEGCGNCIYVDTEEPIYAGYHTILAKKNNEEHGEYLAFLFASTNWRGQVRSAVNGVKVYSITQTILNNTSVILPPVNEQKQIADYIQSAIKPIDAEITRCQQKIALLTERKQILINDVVTGKIKEV